MNVIMGAIVRSPTQAIEMLSLSRRAFIVEDASGAPDAQRRLVRHTAKPRPSPCVRPAWLASIQRFVFDAYGDGPPRRPPSSTSHTSVHLPGSVDFGRGRSRMERSAGDRLAFLGDPREAQKIKQGGLRRKGARAFPGPDIERASTRVVAVQHTRGTCGE